MASTDLNKIGLGPWHLGHDGNVYAGDPEERRDPICTRTIQDSKADEIIEIINAAAEELQSELWTEHQWERIRSSWVDFALQLAKVKIASQNQGIDTSTDEVLDLEAVQVKNFDDAMKILSGNPLA